MIPGIVLRPVWGNGTTFEIRDGDTMRPVGSMITDCLKCPECGHSVSVGGPLVLEKGKVSESNKFSED